MKTTKATLSLRETGITVGTKRILFLLLASASLCFAQRYQLVPRDVRSDETYAAPHDQTSNDAPLLEPNLLLPANPASVPKVIPTPRPLPTPAPRPPPRFAEPT